MISMAFKSTGDLSWVDRFLRVNVMVAALVAGAHGISLATATSRRVVTLLTLSTAAALFIFATGVWVMMRSGEAAKLRVLTLHARVMRMLAR